MTDYAQEQEMEIEALEAILMDDFKDCQIMLSSSVRSYAIVISLVTNTNMRLEILGWNILVLGLISKLERVYWGDWTKSDDDADESTAMAVRLALIFSHTEKYPDEPPLLNVKSLKGIQAADLKSLKEKLDQEASENLGMAMIYTLVTSAQDWLSERFAQDDGLENTEDEEKAKDEVIVPHGEPVTIDTFLAWRERFEAELALERAKLMPESALSAPKEKKLTGRQWFESGRASTKGAATIADGSDVEDEEDIDFDDEDFEDDEEDMLEHYLAEKSDTSSHSSRRAN